MALPYIRDAGTSLAFRAAIYSSFLELIALPAHIHYYPRTSLNNYSRGHSPFYFLCEVTGRDFKKRSSPAAREAVQPVSGVADPLRMQRDGCIN